MKASPIQTSFNGGELSPMVAGRVDVAKYGNGCKRLVGFIPTVQGPAISSPGIRFVSEVDDSADRTWLMRFEFSTDQAYMLEFADSVIRFYTNRAVLLDGGVPYEIASPWPAADLTNADGTFALRFVQTGDVIYIVHPDYPPCKLSRLAPTNWTIAAVDFKPPPFAPLNDTATTMYASAATGAVNIIASASVFTAAMVGQYVYLAEKDVRDNPIWEAGKAITSGNIRRSDGKNFEALNSGTTGSIRPTHNEGAVYDGDGTVRWQYLDAGYGWAKITGYTSDTQVAATVVSRIPNGAVSSGQASKRWAMSAWGSVSGYPTAVTFFRERLVFSRGSTVWFSVAADFENFSYEIDGEIGSDAGFDRTIASDRVNTIRWLSPGNVLLLGTTGDEWAISEQTTNEAFGPANAQTRRQSTYGSNLVAPIRIGDVTLFMQRSGRKMRAMAFRFEEDGFKSDDTTVFADHITAPAIIDMSYQQEPWSIAWCALSDGALVGLTFNREQDVVAWSRRPIEGGVVETVETIPAPDGTRDDLWLIARFTVDGQTKRYIGYLENDADLTTAQADWFYVDFGLTYDGAPATVFSGLEHLEGKVVWVLADGASHPDRTVEGGAITLQLPASKVHVGLPNRGLLETMQLNAGAADGTAQGKTKRVHSMVVRQINSLGGMVGPSEDELQDLQDRLPSTPMGSPPPPFTGDIKIDWPGTYDMNPTVVVVRDKPMPINVVALMPQLVTQDR
ncbi:hypothetical protein [Methylibium sp. Pch-M]|uniref:hypothetical protein n=1 Tax=Methylibium sp. Pch-M TaxID=2082386 RepID=UPI0010120E18|nr:hypothetical protein [Methylibium sp. Pch-M]